MDNRTDQLLKHLGRGGNWQYYLDIKNKKIIWFTAGQPEKLPDWDAVYFPVHPGNKKGNGLKRGGIANVAVLNCLYAEFDQKDGCTLDQVQALEPQPSVIIDSGGGWHCYWLFNDPVIMTSENQDDLAKLQARWVEKMGSDPGAKDLARVLRVPGSVNKKYNPERPVNFLKADFDPTYDLVELAAIVPEPPPVKYKQPVINADIPHGDILQKLYDGAFREMATRGRNHGGFWLACQLRDNRFSYAEAKGIMQTYQSQTPPKDHPYTFRDAIKSLDQAWEQLPREPLQIKKNQPDADYTNEETMSNTAEKPTEQKEQEEKNLAPMLPNYVKLDPELAKEAGKFIETYIQYAESVSPMTPRIFHESAALYMVSVVIARRIKLPMAYDDVYPNLYIAWVAQTTLYKKSTALNIPKRMLYKNFPFLLTPQDFTVEAFISDLAGQQPGNFNLATIEEQENWQRKRDFAAQRGLLLDEFSGLLAAAGKDYNGGLLEATLHLYDCDPYYEKITRSQGRFVVRNAYLSFLGASTPAAIGQHFTQDRLWSMGWWPRFIVLTPENRPVWKDSKRTDEPEIISQTLQRLFDKLPKAKWGEEHPTIEAVLDPEAEEIWKRYNIAMQVDLLTDDLPHLLWGAYGRLPTHALKAAIILAAIDWVSSETPGPRVEAKHITKALFMAEQWRESLHRAFEAADTSEYNRMTERILKIIAKNKGSGITARDIGKAMKDKKTNEITQHLDDMRRGELIELKKINPEGAGRPSERYFIITE